MGWGEGTYVIQQQRIILNNIDAFAKQKNPTLVEIKKMWAITRGKEFWGKEMSKGSFLETLLCELGMVCALYLHIFCSGYIFLTK